MLEYIPEAGDVVWIDFDPQKGNEIQKRRPALVISSQIYNSTAMNLAFFCPITSTRRENPFEVEIPEELEIEGVILSDQAKSMDWRERRAIFKYLSVRSLRKHFIGFYEKWKHFLG